MTTRPDQDKLAMDLANATCEGVDTVAAYLKKLDGNTKDIREMLSVKDGQPIGAAQSLQLKGRLKEMNGDNFSALIYFTLAMVLVCGGLDGTPAAESAAQYGKLKEKARTARHELLAQFRREASKAEAVSDKKEPLDPAKFDNFETLSGMSNEKSRMNEKFILPYKFPDLYTTQQNNVLLFGPPGTGKTQIVKASISELNTNRLKMHFFDYTASSLRSKWEGGTEANILKAFEEAEEYAVAKEKADAASAIQHRSFIFLDEIEALARSRSVDPQASRSVTTLLQVMDGVVKFNHVVVVAATNYPWDLDSAFRRRFTAFIFVDLPDLDGRFWAIATNFFAQLRKKLGIAALCTATLDELFFYENDTKTIPEVATTSSITSKENDDAKTIQASLVKQGGGVALATDRKLLKKLWTEFKSKDFTDAKDIIHKRFSAVFRGYDENSPWEVESEKNGYDERVRFYNKNMTSICGKDLTADLSKSKGDRAQMFNNGVATKLISKMRAIKKKDITVTSNENDSDLDDLNQNTNLHKIYQFILFIALITGPNDFSYQSGYVTNRVTYPFTISDFGYSFSDLDKINAEFFTIKASRVINACILKTSEGSGDVDCCTICDTCTSCKTKGCVGGCAQVKSKSEEDEYRSKAENMTECHSLANPGNVLPKATPQYVFNYTVDNKRHDMRTTFSAATMQLALSRYRATVGTEYCNFVAYDRSPDAGDPNEIDKCKLNATTIRNVAPKELTNANTFLSGTVARNVESNNKSATDEYLKTINDTYLQKKNGNKKTSTEKGK